MVHINSAGSPALNPSTLSTIQIQDRKKEKAHEPTEAKNTIYPLLHKSILKNGTGASQKDDSKTPQSFKFLSLPAELRQKILLEAHDLSEDTLLSNIGNGFSVRLTPKNNRFFILWRFWKMKVAKLRLWTQSLHDTSPSLSNDMQYVERKMFEQLKTVMQRSLVRFGFDNGEFASMSRGWSVVVGTIWGDLVYVYSTFYAVLRFRLMVG